MTEQNVTPGDLKKQERMTTNTKPEI